MHWNPLGMEDTQCIFQYPSCYPSCSLWGSVTHSRCASIWCLERLAQSQMTWCVTTLCPECTHKKHFRALLKESVLLTPHPLLLYVFWGSYICLSKPIYCSVHPQWHRMQLSYCTLIRPNSSVEFCFAEIRNAARGAGTWGNGGGVKRALWNSNEGEYWSESHGLETKQGKVPSLGTSEMSSMKAIFFSHCDEGGVKVQKKYCK